MQPSPKKLAVIIPVFNESQSLGAVLSELCENKAFDIFVVDDASTDDSKNIASKFNVTVLPLSINLGAWNAIQTGMRYVLKSGYKQALTMDADGQHKVTEISKLLAASEEVSGFDVAIGACASRGSQLRKFAWRFFRQLTGVGIEDITSGFRLYNDSAMKTLVSKRGTLLDYQDVGVLLLLQQEQLRVIEVQVDMNERQFGSSHIFNSWVAVGYYMLVTTLLSLSKRKTLVIQSRSV